MAEQAQGIRGFFRALKKSGNAFPMLLVEPMWGIPYNLIMPYFSLYMKGLGCSPEQIGLISTVGMALQVVFSLVAAPITDRLGRKRTTIIFDVISWSGSTLIWVFSQNFYWFLAAAIVQSIFRIVNVSWTCLLVEDTDKSLLVKLFSWLTIAGLLSGLFSPIAAIFVFKYSVVPTMRWLIFLMFAMMTAMFFIRNHFTKETAVGILRKEQSKSEPFLRQVAALFKATGDIWRNKRTLLFFVLSAVYYASLSVKAPFFALLLTGTLGFSDDSVGLFSALSSLAMLAVYLFAQPLLRHLLPKAPLSVGLLLCTAGTLVLLPTFVSYWANLTVVIISVLITAVGMSVAQPLIDGLCHASMDNEKRSNMTSLLNTLIMFVGAPFGWIGGLLYTSNSRLPFVVASVLLVACMVMMMVFYKDKMNEKPV
jgi:MFS transporter, DHA1 family, tetracycline resistance protein